MITLKIPYPTTPYTDNPFFIMKHGVLIPDYTYQLSPDKTTVSIADGQGILQDDTIQFVFCHNYENNIIQKKEFSVILGPNQNTADLPDVFTEDVEYMNRILVFYAGVFIDPKRYQLNSFDRTITLLDIPYVGNDNRVLTIMVFYSGNGLNGAISYIPQSGYLKLNEKYIDRNYTKEMYMLFINGKKIPKSYILDISNSVKKLDVNVKSRYSLEVLGFSPLITEFKNRYRKIEEKKLYTISITQTTHQTIYVRINGVVHTTSFKAEEGSTYDVYIIGEKGYAPGTPSSVAGIVKKDISITATAPEQRQLFEITIRQEAHQLITVYCNGKEYTKTFYEIAGVSFTASVIPTSPGYTVGKLNMTSGTITGNMTISTSVPQPVKCKVEILNKNFVHQSLVTSIYSSDFKTKIGSYTNAASFTTDYGNYIMFQATMERGYKAGKIGLFDLDEFMQINSDMLGLILDPAKGPIKYTVTIPDTTNQIIKVTTYDPAGNEKLTEEHTSSFIGTYGDLFKITVEPSDGYTAGNITTNYSNPTLTSGELTKELIIAISNAVPITKTVNLSLSKEATSNIILSDGNIITPGTTKTVVVGTKFKAIKTLNTALYSEEELDNEEGIITEDMIINPIKKAKEIEYTEDNCPTIIDILPANGTIIEVYDAISKQKYSTSFKLHNIGHLFISYKCIKYNYFTKINIPYEIYTNPGQYISICSSAPLSIQQEENNSNGFYGPTDEEYFNIYEDNYSPLIQNIQIKYKDMIYNNIQHLRKIPLNDSFTVSLLPITGTNTGNLYINGKKILSGSIEVTKDTFESSKIVIGASNIVTNKTCTITSDSNNDLTDQTLIVYNNDKEIQLPATLDLTKENKIKVLLTSNDKNKLPGKANYSIIDDFIDGAVYNITVTSSMEVGE